MDKGTIIEIIIIAILALSYFFIDWSQFSIWELFNYFAK